MLRLLPLTALALSWASPKVEARPAVVPILFSVESPKAEAAPSYVFGTIHAGVSAVELPAFVHAALSRSPVFVMETLPPEGKFAYLPMDMELQQSAQKMGSTILGLESLQFQRNLLLRLSATSGTELLEAGNGVEELIDVYRGGDVEALLVASDLSQVEAEELLYQRNRNWLRKLRGPLLHTGGAFIAVGAAHLPGPEGVLRGLHDLGFGVRRVHS